MDLLRIATAGSVDDGKSTLIGRLLYETGSLKEDQLEHIEKKSASNGLDHLDFSLATDGLLTEREQGITIDVSHLYFKTKKRRFIIADSPGHIEYTRNMVTGTSNSDTTLLLLDARKGVIEQTKRHFYITQLLGIKKIIFAINKMDLVAYAQKTFDQIKEDIAQLIRSQNTKGLTVFYIPLSALKGDNLLLKSTKMRWYTGKTLFDVIENISVNEPPSKENVLQVQTVIRPKLDAYHDYRGFAGKVKSGSFSVGDAIEIFPSGTKTKIKSIEQYGINQEQVNQGENATLLLEDEVNISRGDSLFTPSHSIEATKTINAKVCWMQDKALQVENKYLLQFGSKKSLAKVAAVDERIDISGGGSENTAALELNDIGIASFQLAHTIQSIPYQKNKNLGSFIIIDIQTNNTAGVGFIE
ncbi:MAG: sulfate adenylyltransferase [Candidatus Arcticimaribacter sp.]|nr:MAG: sulfate adenylyltransferase [Candidatus Arcticimaribacter sp.]PTM02306.1 MAG: sulfate adenylyltransferase [Candidatus Arcticimaribacter sp.]